MLCLWDCASKPGFGIVLFVSALVFWPGVLFADFDGEDSSKAFAFRRLTGTIENSIPYNPRPLATDPADVTGISSSAARTQFLATFNRIAIMAPANGRTYKATDSANHDDITVVGYLRLQSGDPSDKPAVILTHGGGGQSSFARSGQALIHLANVLFSNGYNVLALDRRDGLLSRCAYLPDLTPDPARSLDFDPRGTNPTRNCDGLNSAFRDPTFDPNSVPSGRGTFGAGDILAAAKYLQDNEGIRSIGVLAGSRGGLSAIRAAAIQGTGTDFDSELLDAIMVWSPVHDENTFRFTSDSTAFSGLCFIVRQAEFYSVMNGSEIRDYSTDPVGAAQDFFEVLDGVNALQSVRVPTFIVYALSDNQIFADAALAYKARTDRMTLAHTLIMSRLGHFAELWRSDPFWADKLVLTYFKRLLAMSDTSVTEDPGFPKLGSHEDNPFIVRLKPKKGDAAKFQSQESMVPYLVDPDTGECPAPES